MVYIAVTPRGVPRADVLVKGRGLHPGIVVTTHRHVRHPPTPRPKYEQSCAQNNSDMSVTPAVAHVEMWPYVVSADMTRCPRATPRLLF